MAQSKHEVMAGQFIANAMKWQHGEDITYNGTGITAYVDRAVLETVGPEGASIEYRVTIRVARSDVSSVSVGADTVLAKKRITDSSDTTFKVAEVLAQDGACWELRLR